MTWAGENNGKLTQHRRLRINGPQVLRQFMSPLLAFQYDVEFAGGCTDITAELALRKRIRSRSTVQRFQMDADYFALPLFKCIFCGACEFLDRLKPHSYASVMKNTNLLVPDFGMPSKVYGDTEAAFALSVEPKLGLVFWACRRHGSITHIRPHLVPPPKPSLGCPLQSEVRVKLARSSFIGAKHRPSSFRNANWRMVEQEGAFCGFSTTSVTPFCDTGRSLGADTLDGVVELEKFVVANRRDVRDFVVSQSSDWKDWVDSHAASFNTEHPPPSCSKFRAVPVESAFSFAEDTQCGEVLPETPLVRYLRLNDAHGSPPPNIMHVTESTSALSLHLFLIPLLQHPVEIRHLYKEHCSPEAPPDRPAVFYNVASLLSDPQRKLSPERQKNKAHAEFHLLLQKILTCDDRGAHEGQLRAVPNVRGQRHRRHQLLRRSWKWLASSVLKRNYITLRNMHDWTSAVRYNSEAALCVAKARFTLEDLVVAYEETEGHLFLGCVVGLDTTSLAAKRKVRHMTLQYCRFGFDGLLLIRSGSMNMKNMLRAVHLPTLFHATSKVR